MLEITQNDDFVYVVGREVTPISREYLQIVSIPWWRGGGERHIFTPRLREANLFTYIKALELCEIHNRSTFERNVPQSKVLMLRIDL